MNLFRSLRRNPIGRFHAGLILAALAFIGLGSGSRASLTDDQLEYGTRTRDRRFLKDFAGEVAQDFNAPFDLLAKGQQAIQKETGIRFYFDYYADFLGNPIGGRSKAVGYTHEIVAGGDFDLDRILGWKGAVFTASFGEGTGYNLSRNIGNYFTASESYVQDTGVLYDLYLTQKLFDEKLDLRIGRMTAGQFFASLPALGIQVNGGINGNPNNLFSNAPFCAGISSTWAAMLKYKTTDKTYVSAGIFQASPRLGDSAYHGLNFSICPGDGLLTLFEAGWKPDFEASVPATVPGTGHGKATAAVANPGLPGIYKIGGYYSSYTFNKFSGGGETNAYGFYAMGQQMAWRSAGNSNNNFSFWGGVTYSPQTDISLMPVMGYTGTIWQGIIPGRDQDQWLFTFLAGNFSSPYGNSLAGSGTPSPTYEAVLETSYIIQLNKYLSLQPDLQYIIRPGGSGAISNALVVGLQAVVSF